MISAGKLRHRITIQQATKTKDPNTGYTTTLWTDVATVWAAIQPLSAREFIAAQAVQSQVSARIIIRQRDDVKAAMRILHGATVYNIVGVIADQDSGLEYLTLPCSEGTNDG